MLNGKYWIAIGKDEGGTAAAASWSKDFGHVHFL